MTSSGRVSSLFSLSLTSISIVATLSSCALRFLISVYGLIHCRTVASNRRLISPASQNLAGGRWYPRATRRWRRALLNATEQPARRGLAGMLAGEMFSSLTVADYRRLYFGNMGFQFN